VTDLVSPPIPAPDVDTQAWWDSLKSGVFALCYCEACDRYQHPPLEACRRCGARLVLKEAKGTGTLHSFIIQQRAMLPGFEVPYVLGMIELDDEPGLKLTGKVTCAPEEAAIGMRLTAHLERIGESEFLSPVFDPAG